MKGATPPAVTAPIAGLVGPLPTEINAPLSTVTFPLMVRFSLITDTLLLI